MRIIDLKPVRRCGKCFRLIPASMQRCPYCQGTGYMKPEQKTPSQQTEDAGMPKVNFSWSDLSPKTKRYIYIGLAALAAIIAACLIWNAVGKAFALNKSIFEPLDESVVESQTEKDPNFSHFYSDVRSLTRYVTSEEDKAAYKDITYNDFLDFYNCYSSQVFCKDIKEKAEGEYAKNVMAPMKARVDSVKAYWEKYVTDHDVNKYIKVTPETAFARDYGGRYHPVWYYNVKLPKGDIKDCQTEVVFKDFWGDEYYNHSLSDLRQYNSAQSFFYLTNKYATDDDYWDNHSVEVTIKSVTLKDGTVIKADDISKVPPSVTAYLADPSEDNTSRLVIETIDNTFPFKAKYAYDAIIAKLKDKSPKCYELVEKVEKATEKEIVRRGFDQPTFAEGGKGYSLRGTIGDKFDIVMQLSISGDVATGSYYYLSQGPGKRLTLSGTLNGSALTITESENGVPTGGVFRGGLSEGTYEGFYTDPKGNDMAFMLK